MRPRLLASLALAAALGACADATKVDWVEFRSAYRPSQVGLASTEPVLLQAADSCGDKAALASSFSGANPGSPLTFAVARPPDALYGYRLSLACAAESGGATRVRAAFLVSETRMSEAQALTPAGAVPGDAQYRRFAYQLLAVMMPTRDPIIDDD